MGRIVLHLLTIRVVWPIGSSKRSKHDHQKIASNRDSRRPIKAQGNNNKRKHTKSIKLSDYPYRLFRFAIVI